MMRLYYDARANSILHNIIIIIIGPANEAAVDLYTIRTRCGVLYVLYTYLQNDIIRTYYYYYYYR